jgi:mono/diheme cytochrome c family protein
MKWFKRGGIAVVCLVVLAIAMLFIGAWLGDRKLDRHVAVDVQPVAFKDDAASVERGHYLFMSRGCAECHGANGAGKDVINDGKGMLIHAPNITPGNGAIATAYTPLDWTRTIRHGVKPNGRPVMVMPSEDYARLTDVDLASLVSFVRKLAPADGGGAQIQLPLPVKALYAAGVIRDAAEKIDHTLPPAQPIAEGITVEHGGYVANACIGCHGATLSGGKIPGTPPDWPAAANLTPGEGSALARYASGDAFVAMLRSGKRPDGSAISTVMPFAALKELSDTDAQALYLHLKALPPKAAGNR